MKKILPTLIVAFFAAVLAFSLKPANRPDGFDIPRLGEFPVLANGRIKPLDTVARTSLLMIRGKQTLGKRSAMEWLLEVMSKPETGDNQEIFLIHNPDLLGFLGVEPGKKKYFSFHELLPRLADISSHAQEASALESPQRSPFQSAVVNLWDRLVLYQRLRASIRPPDSADFPAEIREFAGIIPAGLEAIRAHQTSTSFDREILARLNRFFERYSFLEEAAIFFPLTPEKGEAPNDWMPMGRGLLFAMKPAPFHPGVEAYAEILETYRNGNSAAFNKAVETHNTYLKERAPKASRLAGLESLFNRVAPFQQGMVLYVAVLLLVFISWLVWPETLQRSAFWLLIFAFAVHTAGLACRILLQGRPPVTNLYSSAVFVGWAAVLFGIILERIFRGGFGSAVAGIVGFSTLIIAHHLTGQGDTMEMMRAVLDSNFWLATHVITITIGYSSTFLAGTLAHIYIFRGLLSRTFTKSQSDALARMTYGVVCFSLLLSFTGTVLGGIWADQSWGRFWGWDPKENGALLIFLWNAVILHARIGRFVTERDFMLMAVFGNIITALSWFGVNMLGIGLHSYGFMDKAFVALSAFIAFQVAVILAGALPSRFWRSRIFPENSSEQ